jgi:hypothetical protein
VDFIPDDPPPQAEMLVAMASTSKERLLTAQSFLFGGMYARHLSTCNHALLACEPQLGNRVAKAEDAPHILRWPETSIWIDNPAPGPL